MEENIKNRDNKWIEILAGKWFPLLLLAVMACAYAIQIPRLGFYLDDWVSIAAYDQGGEAGLIAYGINDSRPFSAWVTAKFFSVLGTGILQWQIITVFWRFAAALCSWQLLKRVWPERKAAAGFISLFFGVFPYFKHQPICIAYFMIMMQYFMILLSFYLTVRALQSGSKPVKALLFILSYLTSLFHLACLEYYLSLEAARLLLIFFTIRKRDGISIKEAVKKAILVYIPYALILLGILVYRFVYIPSLSADVRPMSSLTRYKGFNLVFHFAGLFLQYLTESVFGVWYRSINPAELDLTLRNTQMALGLGLIAAAAVFFLLLKTDRQNDKETREMLVLGTAAMLLGYLPGIMIDVSPSSTSTYHDRYLLPGFWGIAIFTVSWVSLVFKQRKLRYLLFSGMICLGIFFQIQNAFMYRYSWKYQQQFQWSMKWRVPDLEPDTAVITDGVVASFMGGWADSSMLIEMYGKKQGIMPTPYWYFNAAEKDYLSGIESGKPIYVKSKMYQFETEAENVLLITKPEYGKCAWVLDEADLMNPYLESGIETYIPYQNKSRIITNSDHQMPASIFGTDYVHDWCYYFEKADLALDLGRYEEVLALYDEAAAKGISMGNPTEMRPFIKAAAFSGEWDKALAWSEQAASEEPKKTGPYYANLWKIIERDVPDSPEKAEAAARAAQLFGK